VAATLDSTIHFQDLGANVDAALAEDVGVRGCALVLFSFFFSLSAVFVEFNRNNYALCQGLISPGHEALAKGKGRQMSEV